MRRVPDGSVSVMARGHGHGLGRLADLWLAVVAVLLVVFAVAEDAGIYVLTDPRPMLASLSGPRAWTGNRIGG